MPVENNKDRVQTLDIEAEFSFERATALIENLINAGFSVIAVHGSDSGNVWIIKGHRPIKEKTDAV